MLEDLPERAQKLIRDAERLPFPTERTQVLPYLEAKDIPPLEIFLRFQETYGSRKLYAPALDAEVHLGVLHETVTYKGSVPERRVEASAIKLEGKLAIHCGRIQDYPRVGYRTPLELDEEGIVYFSYVPCASSMERWLESEAIAAAMQDSWRPWSVGSIIVQNVEAMIDLGIPTDLPRLTEDTLPFTTWWGNEIVRVQVSHPTVTGYPAFPDAWLVGVYARTKAELQPWLAPIRQTLLSVVADQKNDVWPWEFGSWPRTTPRDEPPLVF